MSWDLQAIGGGGMLTPESEDRLVEERVGRRGTSAAAACDCEDEKKSHVGSHQTLLASLVERCPSRSRLPVTSAKLLAEISDKDMERDYRRYYPDAESYWGVNENGLKVKNGNLEIDVLADDPHASPQHIVTLEYHLSGETLRLIGKPQRRSFEPRRTPGG